MSICDVSRLSLPANVTSPSYPSSYGNNRNCQVTPVTYSLSLVNVIMFNIFKNTFTHHLCDFALCLSIGLIQLCVCGALCYIGLPVTLISTCTQYRFHFTALPCPYY